ncbi:MAG: TraB/GumN family protein [Novosphingobium sp.]
MLLLVVAGLVAACRPAPPPVPEPRPALWEVTGADGAHGWVFGTVHALPPGLAWRTPALDAALARADSLVVEIADQGPPGEARRTFLALATTPGLPPLAQRVASDTRDELARALARARLDPDAVRPLEDWAAALTLAQAGESRRGFASAHGVERALLARARERPVIGLETVEGQFGAFDTLPPAAQRALLEAVVVESATGGDADRLLAAWLRGDVAALDREARAGMLADPRLRAALLVRRNRAWARRVATLLRERHQPFVAVGAAHVAGADGLPALLEAEGFTVRRVQ